MKRKRVDFWQHEPEIKQILAEIQSHISRELSSASQYIRPVLMELVENRGKMLRPAMIYIGSLAGSDLSGDKAGERREQVVELASAMEMLHIASLIHDDIIDDASVRRGKPTVQVKTSVKKAIISGDYMLTRAFSQLTGRSEKIDADVVKNAVCRLCDSEIDQDSELGDYTVSVDHYLRRIAGKTAALFALSLYTGAAAADAPGTTVCRLHQIGYCIGMAFQIQDDILDYIGNEATVGKPLGNDIRCGIATLPLIYALRRDLSGKLTALLRRRYVTTASRVRRVIAEVTRLEGIDEAAATCRRYWQRAGKLIDSLSVERQKSILRELITRLENRNI